MPAEIAASVKARKYGEIKGVGKLLKVLSGKKNVLLGLGTGNVREGAFLKLGPSGLGRHFKFGGFGEDSAGRTVLLKKAVRRAERISGRRVNPSQVYVIGDTHKDIEAAKKAGYHSAAVLGGFGDESAIMRSAPEFMAGDFSDVRTWLMWLGLASDPKGVERGTYICPDTPIEHAHYGMTGLDYSFIESGLRKIRKIKRRP